MEKKKFNPDQLKLIDGAVSIAEELVGNYYKMSSSQWLRSRYDVATLKDLAEEEIVEGPFAQVLGYEGRKKNAALGSSLFNYYKICFQDDAILELYNKQDNIGLFPLLLYIGVHELVHIVRFSTFKHMYTASSESDCALEEEQKVHTITWKILKDVSVVGMDNVLEFFIKWRLVPPGAVEA